MRADQLAVVEMMGEVYAKDRRIAELEAALKELQAEFLAHQEDPLRGATYKWSLTRIGYVLSGSPSALDALLAQERREAITRCIDIAKGCEDYGGGYKELEQICIYHHGMQTVHRCLMELRDGGESYQLEVVEKLGQMVRGVKP